jgi:hypothetical protein
VLREAFDMAGFVKIGGKYFDVNQRFSRMQEVQTAKGQSLHIASGLNLTLLPARCGLLLNADLAMRVARKDTALDAIKQDKQYATEAKLEWQRVVGESLRGAIAASTYQINQRKQTFVIADVLFNMSPASVIPGDPNKKTFADYMKEHHNLTVTDRTQPLLLFRSKTEKDREGNALERWYIPEFVQLVGQSDAMRADTFLQQDLKRACIIDAATRFRRISDFITKVAKTPQFAQFLAGWGMTIDTSMLTCPAAALQPPKISINGGVSCERQWNVHRSLRVNAAYRVTAWAIVYPDNLDGAALNGFIGNLTRDLNKLTPGQFNVAPQQVRFNARPQRRQQELEGALDSLDETIKFVVVVMPAQEAGLYAAVKKRGLQEWSVPTQCVLSKNLMNERKVASVVSRLAAQMVVKTGGLLWAAAPEAMFQSTLVVGVTSSDGIYAVSAAAGGDMSVLGTWTKATSGKRDDIATAIQGMLDKAVSAFTAYTKAAPTRMVVYRPGMNEGDVPRIIQEEATPCQKLASQKNMQLAVVTALKRCSIRFYPAQAGTLIDQHVLPATGFTFLVVPQVVTQGSATAMKFSIISNDIDFGTDPTGSAGGKFFEALTFSQCHQFQGWWGSTREPAVVMYATRAAEMHADNLDRKKPIANPTLGVQIF